jgi:hypothetical protein
MSSSPVYKRTETSRSASRSCLAGIHASRRCSSIVASHNACSSSLPATSLFRRNSSTHARADVHDIRGGINLLRQRQKSKPRIETDPRNRISTAARSVLIVLTRANGISQSYPILRTAQSNQGNTSVSDSSPAVARGAQPTAQGCNTSCGPQQHFCKPITIDHSLQRGGEEQHILLMDSDAQPSEGAGTDQEYLA